MRYLLLLTIKIYWLLIPEDKRRNCIFKISCSQHVFKTTKNKGFKNGLKALRFRIQNCQPNYQITTDHTTGQKIIITKTGYRIPETDIASDIL